MFGKVPLAAFCEEFDEDTNAIIPDTRRVAKTKTNAAAANVTAKRSRPEVKSESVDAVDMLSADHSHPTTAASSVIGSDSGCSSRTAATANTDSTSTTSTTVQSAPLPSGRKSPPEQPKKQQQQPPKQHQQHQQHQRRQQQHPVHALKVDTDIAPRPSGNDSFRKRDFDRRAQARDRDRDRDRERNRNREFDRQLLDKTSRVSKPSTSTTPTNTARKERARDRSASLSHPNEMQVNPYPNLSHQPPLPPLSTKPRKRERESAHLRHHPGHCFECDNGLYHTSTPIESPYSPLNYPYYPMAQSPNPMSEFPPVFPLPATPSMHPYPPPPPSYVQDIHVSNSDRPPARTRRSSSNHTQRPVSIHGMVPGMASMAYNMHPVSPYDHGPPLSSSAYTNTPAFSVMPDHHSHRQSRYHRNTSMSRSASRSGSKPRDASRPRKSSVYRDPPALEYDYPQTTSHGDAERLERRATREPKASSSRRPSRSSRTTRDSDMPPPKYRPSVQNSKSAPANIIQKRSEQPAQKSVNNAASASHDRRSSKNFDFSEMENALPDNHVRRPNHEVMLPERGHSNKEGRPTVYHGSTPTSPTRTSHMNVENTRRSRRRTSQAYHRDTTSPSDMEEKHREAEEYQAARSGEAMPLSDALVNAKASSALASDSGSGSHQSHSSRGSDARTQSGSAVGSRADDENSICMTVDDIMKINFKQDSVDGRIIKLRRGDSGAVELKVEGARPKRYLPSQSDYSGGSGRRELEDVRRPRENLRSERASRRSSRSIYGARGY